jgi:hypothetical protein
MRSERSREAGNEAQLELKYCERCGGLWLRQVGGGQIYCAGCTPQMSQLPPVSREPETARMSQGPQWGADEERYEEYESDDQNDLDAAGGVA